jgi:hypothetical protein
VKKLGLTEREAQAILATTEYTDAEVAQALRVNIHAISAAFSESTVAAIVADKKLDTPIGLPKLEADALHVRTLAGASDKLLAANGQLHAAARVEASALQKVESVLVPQLRARATVDSTLKNTFAPIFAYHHAAHPGHHGHSHDVSATPAAGTTTTT